MITRAEITLNQSIPPEMEGDFAILLGRINQLRALWGKPMIVTSGYRNLEKHIQIYHDKGITDLSKIPMKSKHLFCQAVDIYDPTFALTQFCKDNQAEMEEIGLWFEDDMTEPRLHIQIVAPISKKRWFKP